LPCSQQKKKEKIGMGMLMLSPSSLQIETKKMKRREGAYLYFLVLSILSSPPSSSLVSRISSKFCDTQAREFFQTLEME
jgi:hypothetical protein